MRVTVKLYATLSDYLPAGSKNNRIDVEVADNLAVNAVLAPFSLPPKLTHLVLLNGVFIPADERASTNIKEGDVLAIWPPIAGG
ncbi:MAG: MoaD/ThiS family protein [Rhodocyclaceae bacterium]|nr:MoaD/ThiS family protein [Rhodocyclaceae bacterium]